MLALSVFCGSQLGVAPIYREVAAALGRELAAQGIRLVYGGGNIGLMGVLADAVLDAGGSVTGVIPYLLAEKEVAHLGLTELILVESMHQRKAKMAELSDGFVALPGGFGTFEEFCEVLTWNQLGIHAKPCGLLNIAGFYDPLLMLFDQAFTAGFLRPQHRALVTTATSPTELLHQLRTFSPPTAEKWISEPQS